MRKIQNLDVRVTHVTVLLSRITLGGALAVIYTTALLTLCFGILVAFSHTMYVALPEMTLVVVLVVNDKTSVGVLCSR